VLLPLDLGINFHGNLYVAVLHQFLRHFRVHISKGRPRDIRVAQPFKFKPFKPCLFSNPIPCSIGIDSEGASVFFTKQIPTLSFISLVTLSSERIMPPLPQVSHLLNRPSPAGFIQDIETSLDDPLGAFSLPAPLHGEELVESIRASLHILKAVPSRIGAALLGAVYRSVLGPSDFSLHLCGDTGEGKSVLAALCQQHFGIGFNYEQLPASWSSTENALEGLAFTMKDAIMVVDDFAPRGRDYEMHRKADRLLRAQGNRAGRTRMKPDGSLRPIKYPRGLIISTGEEIPMGKSLRARILILEVSPGDVQWEVVSQCQSAAGNGAFTGAMSSFLKWIAAEYETLQQALPGRIIELRQKAGRSDQHRRTPIIVANLMLGWEYFIEFCREAGAMNSTQANNMLSRAWDALGAAAEAQAKHHAGEDPVNRFFELLTSALASGEAHCASIDGNARHQCRQRAA